MCNLSVVSRGKVRRTSHKVIKLLIAVMAMTLALSSVLPVQGIPAPSWKKVESGRHFDLYVIHPDFYRQHGATLSGYLSFLDKAYDQYAIDFNLTITRFARLALNIADNEPRLIGAAGPGVLSLSGGFVGQADWLARSFLSHELANMFQGEVSNAWPWTDAGASGNSTIWLRLNKNRSVYTSPFPYFCSIAVLRELGYFTDYNRKLADARGDDGVQLLWSVYLKYGWQPYRALFNAMQSFKIDFTKLEEPYKTGIIIVLMTWKTGVDFITFFNKAFTAHTAGITQATIKQIIAVLNIQMPTLMPVQIST